jgi:teichoic acid glycerol-phosphate primase
MIFYPYDLNEYKLNRGVIPDYEAELPGPVVYTTEGLIQNILRTEKNRNNFTSNITIEEFVDKWNEYSDGKASERLINYLIERNQMWKN